MMFVLRPPHNKLAACLIDITSSWFACIKFVLLLFLLIGNVTKTTSIVIMSMYKLSHEDHHSAAAEYRQVYPFSDVDREVHKHFLSLAEDFETMKGYYEKREMVCYYADSLIFVMHILLNQFCTTNVAYCYFADVMAMHSMACMIASIYSIPKCLSIELSDECKDKLSGAHKVCQALNNSRKTSLTTKVGSMQHYFDDEANIVFLSTLELIIVNPMFDEAHVIALALRLCKRLETGAFIIIISKFIDPAMFLGEKEDEYTFNYLKVVYDKEQGQDGNVEEMHKITLLQVAHKKKK
ncbi:hypothetical protein EON65_47115 [archaeon]|nr:MAG: hypothetical protein EON65_47115 [archaeon]